MAKQIRISFRTTQEFKDRVQAAAKKVGLEETVIEAEAIKAVVAHIERHGEITIPVRLERSHKKLATAAPTRVPARVSGLNEPEGDYPSRKSKGRPVGRLSALVLLFSMVAQIGCSKRAPADIQAAQPKAADQRDGFADLRRRDWYEDLKSQEQIKKRAELSIALIQDKERRGQKEGSQILKAMVKKEHAAHLKNQQALLISAQQILEAKTEPVYRALKEQQGAVLYQIETQNITDRSDVAKLRQSSEYEADLLEIDQRYQ